MNHVGACRRFDHPKYFAIQHVIYCGDGRSVRQDQSGIAVRTATAQLRIIQEGVKKRFMGQVPKGVQKLDLIGINHNLFHGKRDPIAGQGGGPEQAAHPGMGAISTQTFYKGLEVFFFGINPI